MAPNSPKVALLIETARGYGRGLLRGIAKYSRLHGPWQFHLTPGDFEQIIPKMHDWGGTGIIARVLTVPTAKALLKTKIPAIFLDFPKHLLDRSTLVGARFIEMSSDSNGAARLAAEHLSEKKFVHFAYAGYSHQIWSEIRKNTFTQCIGDNGYTVHQYTPPEKHGHNIPWESEEKTLAQWLSELPKPIGIFACNDQRGREILDACKLAEISVPEEIAVIGVDNDEILCDLSFPPLSSVALNAEKGGYLAAQVLDEMMCGRKPSMDKIIVEPQRIVERQSTEIVAVDDPDIAAVLQYIHTHATNAFTINEMTQKISISRRNLEIRFRKIMGTTIHQEVQKVRIKRAKMLLQETDFSIPKIADMVGFQTASYFIQMFHRMVGVTPNRFRKTHIFSDFG